MKDKLRELAKKWRTLADKDTLGDSLLVGRSLGLDSCADELASILDAEGDVRRDAERWRFFYNNIGSNGGNGRPGTFNDWLAIIDKMMEDEQRALEELNESIGAAIFGETK